MMVTQFSHFTLPNFSAEWRPKPLWPVQSHRTHGLWQVPLPLPPGPERGVPRLQAGPGRRGGGGHGRGW